MKQHGGGWGSASGGNGVQQIEHNQHSTIRGRQASLPCFFDGILCGHWIMWGPKTYSGISPGEGNGNPLQYSCLENPMDGGAW